VRGTCTQGSILIRILSTKCSPPLPTHLAPLLPEYSLFQIRSGRLPLSRIQHHRNVARRLIIVGRSTRRLTLDCQLLIEADREEYVGR